MRLQNDQNRAAISGVERPTSVTRATLMTLLASLCLQASLVVSGVIGARTLGPENRGYLALLILWPSVIARLGSLGLPAALPYFLAKYSGRRATIARIVARPALIQAGALVTLHLAVLFIFLAGRPSDVRTAALLTIPSVPTLLALDYGLGFLQGQQRFMAFNILRGLSAVLYSAALIALFVTGRGTLLTVTAVLTVSGLLTAALTMVVVMQSLAPDTHGTKPRISQLLWFGIRGLPGSASPIETFRIDQAIVGILLSPLSLGLYVVGLAFTNLPRFVSQAIGMIAYPRVAMHADDNGAWRSVWTFLVVNLALSLAVVTVIMTTLGFTVPFFFGAAFVKAIPLIRILLVGSIFIALRRVLMDAARGMGRPGAGTVAEVSSWLFLVPAIALLGARYGIQGVGIAFTTTAGISLAVLIAILAVGRSHATFRLAG